MKRRNKITKEMVVIAIDKALEYSLYAMILFIPISITIIEVLFMFSATLFALKKILRPDFRAFKDIAHIALLIFFAFSAASLINSGPYLAKSFHSLFSKWFEYIVIFMIIADVMNTPARVRNCVKILLICGALIGLDAVFQKITGFDLFRHRELIIGRTTAAFKVTNVLAAYLVPVLVSGIALVFSKDVNKREKIFLILSSLLLTSILILTFSRAGWLGFTAGLILLFLLSRNIKIAFLPLLIFLTVLLAVPALRDRATAHGDAQRVALFNATTEMIGENPFLGKGVGTYMDHYSRRYPDKSPAYAHNSYMQVWAETGIFSFLSFIAFLAIILVCGIQLIAQLAYYG
ncbi:MAG: O-antigen ligase family protein [Candidatus Omnitrophota bacterium]